MRLFVLTDYLQTFGSSTRRPLAPMDLDTLVARLRRYGVEPEIRPYSEVRFPATEFRDQYVVYQSSEDTGLHYKSYIEDVLLGLRMCGARLLPKFEFFRAHHNKVFMEILRSCTALPHESCPRSRVFGTQEDFEAALPSIEFPVVLKPSAGHSSRGVTLARNAEEARQAARDLSSSFYPVDVAKDIVKTWIRPYHKRRSDHRRKFVVQEYLDGLSGDFKILVYGDRVFALGRENRVGDFRASGSGRFKFKDDVPRIVLDCAVGAARAFDVPILSLDIAIASGTPRILEFQFLMFGNYTLEKSPFHFTRGDSTWQIVPGTTELEDAYASAVAGFLERKARCE